MPFLKSRKSVLAIAGNLEKILIIHPIFEKKIAHL
jgi:hypothetical protein